MVTQIFQNEMNQPFAYRTYDCDATYTITVGYVDLRALVLGDDPKADVKGGSARLWQELERLQPHWTYMTGVVACTSTTQA